MSKIDLSLEEKTSIDLSLEEKGSDMTWEQSDPGTWGEANSVWGNPKEFITIESKTKVSLNLESK